LAKSNSLNSKPVPIPRTGTEKSWRSRVAYTTSALFPNQADWLVVAARLLMTNSEQSPPASTLAPGVRVALKTEIVVIGAGQAGLSSAYHLKRRGLTPNQGFVVLDHSAQPGGAWQFRWPRSR
jgi:NAD(P)-binding Rossmann-like domain